MKVRLNVNGFSYDAIYSDREVEDIYIPLLKDITKRSKEIEGRYIVFMAAPPGTGKSTLSLILEKLSRETEGVDELQAISLDGFHHFNSYLKNNYISVDGKKIPLSKRKGSPESFDLESIKIYLDRLKNSSQPKWPIYDRQLHDPVMDAVSIESDIVLIEGNWLLLDEDGWKDLSKLCDYSIFIEASEELLKDRLVSRKERGGLSYEEALNFYETSDKLNVNRVLQNRKNSDLTLKMLESGENTKI